MYCFKISKERSNDRHIGRNWSDGHMYSLIYSLRLYPIKTARAYCMLVSNGQWMEDDVVAASHHIRTYASMRQIHSSSSPHWILLDIDATQTMQDII